MKAQKMAAMGAILLILQVGFAQVAYADASYQSTTQITGGTLVDAMKSMSFLGGKAMKDMFAPISTVTMVHGNQKAVVSKDSTEITDLDKEQIIRIDNLKKTYTITTFAEMRQAFANMPKQMEQMQAQVKQAQAQEGQAPQAPSNIHTSFETSVKNTGVSKEVNGLTAQEQVVTLTMKVTMDPPPPGSAPSAPLDPTAPNSINYTLTTDTWIAPDPPEIKEIQDFDVRMGQTLMKGVDMKQFAAQFKQMQAGSNAAMAQLLGGKPGAADAMKQMAEEEAKLKGTRVLEVTSMGGLAPAGSIPPAGSAPPPAMPSGQTVAGQVATDTATQTAAGESGKMGVFGSALSSSALRAFGRKKATPPPPPPPPPPSPAATPAAGGPAMQNVVMMATTTQKTNFSQQPVPFTAFVIPAGYKKVESPYQKVGK